MDKDLLRSLTEPKKEHKHTKGEWKITEFWNKKIIPAIGISTKSGSIHLNFNSWADKKEEAQANAKLIAIAPKLLEIAEMYLDSMKGSDKENGIAYQLVEKTLKKLE